MSVTYEEQKIDKNGKPNFVGAIPQKEQSSTSPKAEVSKEKNGEKASSGFSVTPKKYQDMLEQAAASGFQRGKSDEEKVDNNYVDKTKPKHLQREIIMTFSKQEMEHGLDERERYGLAR